MAPTKLRDLIKAVRATKTQQEEREVVQKECASIRDGFRKDDSEHRARHVAKLLYVHMLGYPAHFGQLECLKLVTSNRFNDKRIGYLGSMMLLDELKDVHMLITNSLKNDLGHAMQYVAGLALCTLGTICSVDMARDLADEVEKLLKSSNTYIRKKAVLCAVRIIRKVPELMDNFVPATRSLLGEKNHGVLITGVTLITEMCLVSPDNIGHFRRMVPTLNRLLKNLVMTGYSPEHDVSGVTDPFLQCKILRLLRILCKDDPEASDSLNDILAQVATNTDSTKTAGNAILYETVMCIMGIHAEQGLRVLAINSLGKFLRDSDRNIRYVALTTMLSIVQNPECFDAVAKHRGPIIDCLSEPDSTIRKRALVLIFALINGSNVENLVRELVEYLTLADTEYRTYMVKELFAVAQKFSPRRQWHVDTLLSIVERAPAHVPDDLIPAFVQIFADNPDLHGYIVHKIYGILKEQHYESAACQIGAWCIGEFGDHLLSSQPNGDAPPSSGTVLDLLQKILNSPTSNEISREYTFTAVMKLSARMPSEVGRIRTMVGSFADNMSVELQQRSSEYTMIFNQYNSMRNALLERMPVAENKSTSLGGSDNGGGGNAVAPNVGAVPEIATAPATGGGDSLLGDLLGGDDLLGGAGGSSGASAAAPTGGSGLEDLLGLDLGMGAAPPMATTAPATTGATAAVGGGGGLMDLLGGGGGGGGGGCAVPAASSGGGGAGLMDLLGSPVAATQPTNMSGGGNLGGLGDLLGGGGAGLGDLLGGGGGAPPADANEIPSITAWNKDGLTIQFAFKKNPAMPNVLEVQSSATNSSPMPMSNFMFQVAVPKTHQLQMQPPSGNMVPPSNSGAVTQTILVNNPQKIPIRMRVKISFDGMSGHVDELGEISNFPPNAV